MSKRENQKKRIVFVGAFGGDNSEGRTGGQLFACNSLVNSSLKEVVDWIEIDSMTTNHFPNVSIRSAKAFVRVLKLSFHLVFGGVDAVLIFSAHGTSFYEKGLMALLAHWRGKRVLFAPRSGYMEDWSKQNGRIYSFVKKVFLASDVVICQGRYWKETFQDLFPDIQTPKFKVIPNWLDAPSIRVQVASANTIKTEGQIDALFLGWVDRAKGVFELIEAASLLKESHKNIVYHICGFGIDFDEATTLVDQRDLSDSFVFHGWTKGSAKFEMLKMADLFILPTHFEGFPNALLEAMTAGIPSIVTRVGAVGEVLDDGRNGIEIPILDPSALSKAIARLADDAGLRDRLGKAATETIDNKFTIRSAVEKFQEII